MPNAEIYSNLKNHNGIGLSSFMIYISPINTTHPTVMAMAMMGRLTVAKSNRFMWMCFLPRISRHSRPASEALMAVLKAPKLTPRAMV